MHIPALPLGAFSSRPRWKGCFVDWAGSRAFSLVGACRDAQTRLVSDGRGAERPGGIQGSCIPYFTANTDTCYLHPPPLCCVQTQEQDTMVTLSQQVWTLSVLSAVLWAHLP